VRRDRTLRLVLLAAVALAAGGAAALLDTAGALHRTELATVDQRFAIRGDHRPRQSVVLVALDSRTVAALGRPPLPRSVHARVLDRLHAAGARLVAFDFRFAGATEPREDRALVQAIRRARPVVLGTVDPDGVPVPVPAGERHPARIGAVPASLAVPTDRDGEVRRMLYAPVELRTLPVRAAEIVRGRPVAESNFPGNHAWIDFPGGPGTVPTYSLVDVLRGRVAPAKLRGRVVVVGPTDPFEKDVFDTPATDLPMSGAEVEADAIATVLDGFPLRSAPGWLDALLLVALAALPALVALRRSAWLIAAAGAAGLAALLAGAQIAFDSGRIVSVVAPAVAAVLATTGALGVHFELATRERRRLRTLFGRFVPPEVVDLVIAQVDDDLRLGGVRCEATVMFCDLRGFTAFSEPLEPERVLEVINQYLSEMTGAIMDAGGTLLNYMGDGILALFGAPIEHPDHADRAVRAARDMLEVRLPRFNAWVREQGLDHQFRMGIGINSGMVMAGNVGSQERLGYTALGDVLNTAARIEAMTKDTPHQAFVAQATRDRLGAAPDGLVYVDELAVRGRAERVRVWTL
jgi:adenylate cyclase